MLLSVCLFCHFYSLCVKKKVSHPGWLLDFYSYAYIYWLISCYYLVWFVIDLRHFQYCLEFQYCILIFVAF